MMDTRSSNLLHETMSHRMQCTFSGRARWHAQTYHTPDAHEEMLDRKNEKQMRETIYLRSALMYLGSTDPED